MPIRGFQTDERGDIITKPLMGWVTAPVANMALLLAIEYAETPQEIESGGKVIQLVMTPKQCLQLAETLTTRGKALIDNPPEPGKRPM